MGKNDLAFGAFGSNHKLQTKLIKNDKWVCIHQKYFFATYEGVQ
jgi:hypothetical protein